MLENFHLNFHILRKTCNVRVRMNCQKCVQEVKEVGGSALIRHTWNHHESRWRLVVPFVDNPARVNFFYCYLGL